jgi:hypothetical protein
MLSCELEFTRYTKANSQKMLILERTYYYTRGIRVGKLNRIRLILVPFAFFLWFFGWLLNSFSIKRGHKTVVHSAK